jgi:hypothetical protein
MLLVRRQFAQSKLLITHALMLTKHHFDECKRYSCTLLDFGLFLMNMDKTEEAVKVYQVGHCDYLTKLNNLNLESARLSTVAIWWIKFENCSGIRRSCICTLCSGILYGQFWNSKVNQIFDYLLLNCIFLQTLC